MRSEPGSGCRGAAAATWLLGGSLLLTACGGGDTAPNAGTPAAASATFAALPAMAGYAALVPHAISGDGNTVAGVAQNADGAAQAFRWSSDAGMTGLGYMAGGRRSEANALSFDGTVAAGTGDAAGSQPTSSAAFRWTAGRGMQQLPPVTGGLACAGAGVSGDGEVVVGTCLAAGNTGFRWTQGDGSVGLPRSGGGTGASSMAVGISRDGTTAVGGGNPLLAGAMLWQGVQPLVIGKLRPADPSAQATAVSRDGSVVVGVSTDAAGVTWPFRWTASGGMAALLDPPGPVRGIVPAAVSGDGVVVVGWGAGEGSETAMIRDSRRGMRPLVDALQQDYRLDLAGWALRRASGVSDDGRVITGHGTDPAGATRGWIVRLQP